MAERCKRTAEAPPNIKIKKQFMDLARQWRELAEHAKRRGGRAFKKAELLMLASAPPFASALPLDWAADTPSRAAMNPRRLMSVQCSMRDREVVGFSCLTGALQQLFLNWCALFN